MTFNLQAKIISWNIQSTNTVSGSKFDNPEFCAIFENFPFVCLQETRQAVKHPGYRSFNNTRRDEKYGGVCILVKNEISKGVKQVKSTIVDVIVCKLDKYFFGLENDTFLVNSYIKPANTSSINSDVSGLDTLRELDQLINDLLGKGDVISCGDFNSRIGTEPDFIAEDTCETTDFIPLPDDYTPQDLTYRNSRDKITNSYKRPLLDMLINNKLHILNGRTLGDYLGEFTCIKTIFTRFLHDLNFLALYSTIMI
jgi:hypothetical protein